MAAHAAAGGTLQERLKTAASESATTSALERKGLERIRFQQGWIGLYAAITQGGILVPCFALLGFTVEDTWTPKGQAT